MEGTVWKDKSIDNLPEEPWLDWIVAGTKRFEGRINRNDWAKMKVGDTIILVNGDRQVPVKIVSLDYYPTFGAAFAVHDKQLLPHKDTEEAAVALYQKIFWTEQDKKDLAAYGALIIGIEL